MAEPTANPVPTPPAPEPAPNAKLLVPQNDAALAEVARLVNETWAAEPWLTLRWLPQPDYAKLSATLADTMKSKREAATTRTPQTQRLQEVDDEMDEALRVLKNYVLEDAKYNQEAAKARYGTFGLVTRRKGGYILSTDRGERLVALQTQLLPAVQAAPFAGREYGTAFWAPRVAEYATLMGQAEGLAGQVTKSVSKKDETKKQLRKALQALVFALRANYPDTYEAELSRWGFRKTNY